jgi:hypothetical protein
MYSGMIDCAVKMLKTEGFSSYYRGIVPPMLGVGALNAVLFGTYSATKRFLQRDQTGPLSLAQVFTCGMFILTALCPLTTLKRLRALIFNCRRGGWLYVLHCDFADGTSQMP